MEFNATVKGDSLGQLRGGVKCAVTSGGLTVTKGKNPPLLIPIGTSAAAEGRSVLRVMLPDRQLSLAVQKFGAYQGRIAADVAAYLRGERQALAAGDYRLEPYLLVLSFLPFGIMILTRGGALWGAIGGGLAMLCLVVSQNEKLPILVRLLIVLGISACLYGLVLMLVVSVPG